MERICPKHVISAQHSCIPSHSRHSSDSCRGTMWQGMSGNATMRKTCGLPRETETWPATSCFSLTTCHGSPSTPSHRAASLESERWRSHLARWFVEGRLGWLAMLVRGGENPLTAGGLRHCRGPKDDPNRLDVNFVTDFHFCNLDPRVFFKHGNYYTATVTGLVHFRCESLDCPTARASCVLSCVRLRPSSCVHAKTLCCVLLCISAYRTLTTRRTDR